MSIKRTLLVVEPCTMPESDVLTWCEDSLEDTMRDAVAGAMEPDSPIPTNLKKCTIKAMKFGHRDKAGNVDYYYIFIQDAKIHAMIQNSMDDLAGIAKDRKHAIGTLIKQCEDYYKKIQAVESWGVWKRIKAVFTGIKI